MLPPPSELAPDRKAPNPQRLWTVKEVLESSSKFLSSKGQTETPRLDAELLLSEALGCRRIDLYVRFDRPVNEGERQQMREWLWRRQKGEPVAYILGYKEFFGARYAVNRAVLIPRPDSETLILRVLDHLRNFSSISCSEKTILDIATGSGCLGIALALNNPRLRVDGWDLSPEAVALANSNAEAAGVSERFQAVIQNALDVTSYRDGGTRYDLVISNPPYLATAEIDDLQPNVKDFEPHAALDGGGDGLQFYRAFAEFGSRLTNTFVVEIGASQAASVADTFSRQGWSVESVVKDLSGLDRVIVAHQEGE